MEIKITTGTYNTSNYRVVKTYKSLNSAQKYINQLGYKGEVYDGLQFSSYGTNYNISINN